MLQPPKPKETTAPDPTTTGPAAPGIDPEVADTTTTAPAGDPATDPVPTIQPAIAGTSEERIEVNTWSDTSTNGKKHPGRYHLVFSNKGARLAEVRFRDYYVKVGLSEEERLDPENWLVLAAEVETAKKRRTGSLLLDVRSTSDELLQGGLGLSEVLWKSERIEGPEKGVEFTYAPGNGLTFRKRITAVPDSWHLRMRLTIENEGAPQLAGEHELLLTPAGCVPAELGDRFYTEPRAVAVGQSPDGEYDMDWESASGADAGGDRLNVDGRLDFAGMHNKYFAFFLRDADPVGRSMREARYDPVVEYVDGVPVKDSDDYVEARVFLKLDVPASGSKASWEYTIYAGPKDSDVLVEDHEAHQLVLDKDLSTFSTIGSVLLLILGFFHNLVGNWGVAIILLTICVRGVLFPLNRRSQTSMARYQKKMKRVQPLIEEAKKRHANDATKQREAQAKIMQEQGAFPPLGGCLPIFLQIPIFFGLFSALRTSFDLRQAPFVSWIDDLSRPDRLLQLDWNILGFHLTYLNLLPLLMVVLWIWQQRGMPQPQDEQAKRMQKMMAFMPVVFGFLLYNYAAGLSVYMITQSGLGIVEQKFIKKMWPIDDTELEKGAKKSGCGPFSGMMQNFAEKQREQMKHVEAMRDAKRLQSKKQRKKRR